eukprot:233729_1
MDTLENKSKPDITHEEIEQQKTEINVNNVKKRIKCEWDESKICSSVNYVLNTLKYYYKLDVVNSQDDRDKLVKYCTTSHEYFLDDYIHLIKDHSNDIDEIRQYDDNECNIRNCLLLKRQYRYRHEFSTQNQTLQIVLNDKRFTFWMDIMDGMHCYLYHLYDIGLRVKITSEPAVFNNNECIDKTFAQIYKVVNEKQKELKNINGFDENRINNNRFNITATKMADLKLTEETFMDKMHQFMIKFDSTNFNLKSLNGFLNKHEYDSDACIGDMENIHSNIKKKINNSENYETMKEFIKQTNIPDSSFSIGFIFYYWNIYKHKLVTKEKQSYKNKNDLFEYQPYELYIEAKYDNLQDEMLNNKIVKLKIDEFNYSDNKAMQ